MEQAGKTVCIEGWNGIRGLALMSIGADKGSRRADPDFGSGLYLLQQSGKVGGQTAGALRRMPLECAQRPAGGGPAEKIDCGTERAGKNEIEYRLIFFNINGGGGEVKEVRNAV